MQRFFSIIVPAHNEEQLIGRTLQALGDLDYPKERYEILVIENGSTDATYAEAKKFESDHCHIYTIEQKGVSGARNFGITHASADRDWSVTVDADTILGADFLNELNMFLDAHPKATYGMAKLTPVPPILSNRFWFGFRNWRDRWLRTLDTVHIVRKDAAAQAQYPEEYNFTEDLQYATQLRQTGKYFFMPTKNVLSSARRYEKQGYGYVFFKDLLIGALYTFWPSVLKGKHWDAVR